MPDPLIRLARPEDADEIVRLVHALAEYENEPAEIVKLPADVVRRDAFGDRPRFEALLAEHDGAVVGLALYYENYSTWQSRPGLFLEDLFVEERVRGLGLGHKLMAAIAAIAIERGYGRIDLGVLHWNPTRDFYHRLGFQHIDQWLPYRLEGPAIADLAKRAEAG